MANRCCVITPMRHDQHLFAAYPMVQVAMSRWGYHRPGTWKISVFLGDGFDFIARIAVVDDFGTLVEVNHG